MKLKKKFKTLDAIFYLNNLLKVLNFHYSNEIFQLIIKINLLIKQHFLLHMYLFYFLRFFSF